MNDLPMPFSSFPSSLLSFYSSLSLPSCCGAGTAADTEKTTDLLSSNLTIFSLNSGRNPRVIMAVNILQDMLYRFVEHQTCTCMSCTTAPTFKICWSDLMTQYTFKQRTPILQYDLAIPHMTTDTQKFLSYKLSQCFTLLNEQMKGKRG